MTEKLEYFLVNLTIIECRHLAWPNMDSAVDVKVDNQRQCTEVHYNDDSPFFSEVNLLNRVITIYSNDNYFNLQVFHF